MSSLVVWWWCVVPTTIGTRPASTPLAEFSEIVVRGGAGGATYAPRRGGPEDDDLLESGRRVPIATGGGCVARAPDGRVVFVRHALPGERVLARVTSSTSSYLRADAVEIDHPSPDRVTPPCPHAGPGRCGGCDFQHVSLPAQRQLKAFRVAEQLAHLAGVERRIEVEPVDGDRRRARMAHPGARGGGPRRQDRVPPPSLAPARTGGRCPVASPAVTGTGVLAATWPGVAELEIMTGDQGDALVSLTPRGRRHPRPPEIDRPEIDAGLVERGTVRRPPGAVHTRVHGRSLPRLGRRVLAGARRCARRLLSTVLALVGDCRDAAVVDLYAGAGLFAVPLADRVGPGGSLTAVERDPRACADLRHNGTGRASLHVLEEEVTPDLVAERIGHPAVVVLDPAREGAGTSVMGALAAHARVRRTARLRLVRPGVVRPRRCGSCSTPAGTSPALRAFDIFPMTEHVELVAAFDPRR